MTQKNSLMEWVYQTRKIAKEVDYLAADTIDSIITCLPLIHTHTILSDRDFYEDKCKEYHKINPIRLLKQRKVRIKTLPCNQCDAKGKCGSILDEYVRSSVKRCRKAMEMVLFQWWEIIDFMWDRPELIDPNIVNDTYIYGQIENACKDNKKNNPLKNGMRKRFGRYWKDQVGTWRKERRRRF